LLIAVSVSRTGISSCSSGKGLHQGFIRASTLWHGLGRLRRH
jgi:hypothetical protein